jgi:hypothetical protein
MNEDTTRQERREERKAKEAAFRSDNRRSVRMQAILSARPKPKRHRRPRGQGRP